jgi:hypothetical protein
VPNTIVCAVLVHEWQPCEFIYIDITTKRWCILLWHYNVMISQQKFFRTMVVLWDYIINLAWSVIDRNIFRWYVIGVQFGSNRGYFISDVSTQVSVLVSLVCQVSPISILTFFHTNRNPKLSHLWLLRIRTFPCIPLTTLSLRPRKCGIGDHKK